MNHFEEDPLEQLLDEQSDSEFGLPELASHKQDLKTWTAQDFSNIYTRFHPHLLRHAKRYLTNHAQAEEVVQDAFLYLMTSLPEIDSEIGVLKLLKWKVRLLAIDVIRLNGKASFAPVEAIDDIAIENELSETLIKADEAAIVSLALAKLNPRQREALIASVYQEKETAQVASQLGLSENATRQLLFRAKSAFKKALVGEAETAGMSISQILSVAARKAAAESGKYISAASALVIVLAISIGILPNLPQQGQVEVAGQANVPSELQNAPVPDVQAPLTESQLQASGEPTPVAAAGSIESQEPVSPEAEEALPNATLASTTETQETAPVENARPTIRTASLAPYLDLAVQQAEVVKSSTSFFPNATNVIKIHSGVGLWAYVDYEPTTMTINAVAFEVMIDGQPYFASPRSFGAATTESATGYTLTYSATEIFLIDSERNVLSEQDLASAFVTVMLQLNQLGDPIGANLFIQG